MQYFVIIFVSKFDFVYNFHVCFVNMFVYEDILTVYFSMF